MMTSATPDWRSRAALTVAPQDPQRGRLERAAAFSTWARAMVLTKTRSVTARMNLVLDRIPSPLSSGVNSLAPIVQSIHHFPVRWSLALSC